MEEAQKNEGKVFISYRRVGGFPYAMILAEKLEERGYEVFWDVESRDSGRYDEKIREEITACEVFLLILSHGALDRCVSDGDMVRQEILQAMEEGKDIVVFMEGNFHFPETLPEEIAAVKYYNGVELFYSSYKAAFAELYERVKDAVERARSEKASEGLRFEPNEDCGYTVAGVGVCKDTEIVIPKKYRGKPVTGIGENAFSHCDSLIGITIPEGVKEIEKGAFSDCASLTSITIPEKVTKIGYKAFCCCTSLTSITIPRGVTEIEEWAFSGCTSLTSITFPEGIIRIGNYAFSFCSSLTCVTIPRGVTEIGEWEFQSCTSLTGITIPKGVTKIGERAFCLCISLTAVYFNGTKKEFKKISFGNNWNTDAPFKVVHCLDGDVPAKKSSN